MDRHEKAKEQQKIRDLNREDQLAHEDQMDETFGSQRQEAAERIIRAENKALSDEEVRQRGEEKVAKDAVDRRRLIEDLTKPDRGRDRVKNPAKSDYEYE